MAVVPVERGEWDVVRRLVADLAKRCATVVCDVDEAVGRIVADDVRSLIDLPTADVSAMDGWAVCGPAPWSVVGRIANGVPSTWTLAPGEALAIGTGGVVPDAATGIVRREHGEVVDAELRWSPPPGVVLDRADVRRRGEEARVGEIVITAGTRLDPMAVAMAAGLGHDELEVVGTPRVDLLVTGDEVVARGVPAAGQVRDSVGPAVRGMVRACGARLERVVAVRDGADALAAQLRASGADLVVTTGGTAGGDADHLREALRLVGAHVVVDRVAVRPGGPTLLAVLADGRLVAGLPGNPLAAVVGFLAVVQPALRTMAGGPDVPDDVRVLGVDLPDDPRGTRVVPYVLTDGRAVPTSWTSASMLRGLVAAEGLLVVPPGARRAGDPVRAVPAPWRAS